MRTQILLTLIFLLLGTGPGCSSDSKEPATKVDAAGDVSTTLDTRDEDVAQPLPDAGDARPGEASGEDAVHEEWIDGQSDPDLPDACDGCPIGDMVPDLPGDLPEVPDVIPELPQPDQQGDETMCTPGAATCDDDVTLSICAEDGMGFTTETCPESEYCLGGQCVPWVCVPGEAVCNGTFATQCNEFGSGPAQGGENCSLQGEYCISGECIKCFPDCFGKSCGDDGCGGSCGNCDDDNVCTLDICDAGLFTCGHSPMDNCCLDDPQCEDEDPCTDTACVNNVCVADDLCCDFHWECGSGAGGCAQGVCLNNYCFDIPVPEQECCPKHQFVEGMEFGVAWDWSLTSNGIHKWQLVDTDSHGGVYSMKGDKWHIGAVATLPPVPVPWSGAALQFWYKTEAWANFICDTGGTIIRANGIVAETVCEPAADWTFFSLDLSPWAGLDVTLTLENSIPGNADKWADILLDDMAVIMPCCVQAWDCDDNDPCTGDICGAGGECEHEAVEGCCTPGLMQEDFEYGTALGWNLAAAGTKTWAVSNEDSHTGTYALLGTDTQNGCIAHLPGSYAIPAGGGSLKFWHRTLNWNVITWGVDGITVYVNGAVVSVVSTPSPGWAPLDVDLSPWAGQEVSIWLKYSVVAAGNNGHRVYIDDLQVTRNCCTADDECDDGDDCTEDSCGLWGACLHDADPGCCVPVQYGTDFDSGMAWGWSLSADGILDWAVSNTQAHSGEYSLYASGYDNKAVASLPGKHYVPWSGAHLRFYYFSEIWNVIDCSQDGIFVYANGALMAVACEVADGWTFFEADLRAWAGEEVDLAVMHQVLTAGNNGHTAYIDDVEFAVDCCSQDSDCDDGNPCTTDACTGENCVHVEDPECCNEEMTQEDFELGVAWNWTLAGGNLKAWALTQEDAASGLVSLTSNEYQNASIATLPSFTVPYEGASLELVYKSVGWVLADCVKEGLAVIVNGTFAGTACTQADDWTPFSVDLSPWAGQTVVVRLRNYLPLGNTGHKVFVDDVTIVRHCCSQDADCDDEDPCTDESCSPGGACLYEAEESCCNPGLWGEDFELGAAWLWSLSADGYKKWEVTALEEDISTFALTTGQVYNGAVATLPGLPMLPWEGGILQGVYKTLNWVTLDCETMGVRVFVNGTEADALCDPAEEWTGFTVDLLPWIGQELTIELYYNVGNGANPNHAVYIDDLTVIADCP